MLKQLQADQTLLFHFWLHSVDKCSVSWEEAHCRWRWGWVSGAAVTGLLDELVDRVIHKTVGSRLAAVLNTEGQLCRCQGLLNTIHIYTESVGVYGRETRRCKTDYTTS